MNAPAIITDDDRRLARKARRGIRTPSPPDFERGYLVAVGWARRFPQYATDPHKQALAHTFLNQGFTNRSVSAALSFREGFQAGLATLDERAA